MIRRPRLTARIALFACAALASARPVAAADAGGVKLTRQVDKVVVEVGGKPFTAYRFAKEAGKPWARPFLYPVLAADGTPLTSDQVVTNPKEHPHHRSIYVAQGAVNGLDHWAHAKPGQTQVEQRHVSFDKVEGDTIVQQLTWDGADGKPMLAEQRTWRFMALPDGGRGIDLTSRFTAVSGPVTFGETKEGGLCSVRVSAEMSKAPTITMSTGAKSVQNADKAKKVATDESKVWGKKAAWCDISGEIGGKTYGIAVLDHPENPRHPSNWHVRRYGLMGANVFGLHEFDRANPKGSGDLKVEPGTPVEFKYRIVIHDGDAASAKLDQQFEAFAGKKAG